MAVNLAQQVICRDVIIKAEVVEELRRKLTDIPSWLIPPQINAAIESQQPSTDNSEFANGIGRMGLLPRAKRIHRLR